MSQQNGQTTRMDGIHPDGSPGAVVGNVKDIMHDITHLAVLQAKLLATDSKAALKLARLPIVAMVFGVCLTLGCVPIAILALADVIQTGAEVSRPVALGCAAGAGLMVSAMLQAVGWWRLRIGFHAFDRSRHELSRNIVWFKQTLRGDHRRSSQLTNDDTLA